MKKNLTLITSLLFSLLVFAQAPQSFNYQGVARNTNGQPYASQTMNIRLTVHSGTANGNIEYGEVRTITTNAFGLFNIQVGSPGANTVQGSFQAISWGLEKKFLQTEINLPGANNYSDLGTVAMQSVPYALHSVEAADLKLPFDRTASQPVHLFKLTNTNSETNAAAGSFNSTVGYGIHAYSESGTAVKAQSSFGTALEADGGLLVHGGNTNPGLNKVLTSDAFGNATWQPNLASGFRLPIDTTIAISNNQPLIRIRNTQANSVAAVMNLESRNADAFDAASDSSFAIRGYTKSSTHNAILGTNLNGGAGVGGYSKSGIPGSIGVQGTADGGSTSSGVLGDGGFNSVGVKGISNNYMGVAGISQNQIGIYGASTNGYGIEAVSTNSSAVYAISSNDYGIIGQTSAGNKAGVVGNSLQAGGIGILGEAFTTSTTGVKAKGSPGTTALEVDGAIKIHGTSQFPGVGKVLTSDANGVATWENPYAFKKIGFSANSLNPTSVPPSVWVKVPFKNEEYDGHNDFTTASQNPAAVFTVPVTGLYHLDAQVAFQDFMSYPVRGHMRIVYQRNNLTSVKSDRYGGSQNTTISSSFDEKVVLSISGDFKFEAGDKVWIEISQNNFAVAAPANLDLAETVESFFSGHLIFEN